MASRKLLGPLIRCEREKRSWSQAQLSEIAGLNIRTIQRAESTGRCSHETLLAIAAAFDIDVTAFTARMDSAHLRQETDHFLPAFFNTWMQRLGIRKPPFRLIAILSAALTSSVAFAAAWHTLAANEGPLLWTLSYTLVCFLIILVGLLTGMYFLTREHARIKNWLILFGAMLLLVMGAAGAVWGVHMAEITGDLEAWAIMTNLILIGQGTVTILSLHN